jgi:hypothetical protein
MGRDAWARSNPSGTALLDLENTVLDGVFEDLALEWACFD